MNAPTHHVDDDVLLDYMTGAASEPVSLVVACHLTLCAACRQRADAAEAVGGALLDGAPRAALSEHALDQVLARLDEPAAPRMPAAEVARPFEFEGIALPRPLAGYLTAGDGHPRSFQFVAPGIRGINLPVKDPGPVRTRLLRLSSGIEIPHHAHAGDEFTLIFAGGLSDDGEHYERGDVRYRATDAVHAQKVDPGAPCFALVVNEGALVPRTLRGKVLSLLFDR